MLFFSTASTVSYFLGLQKQLHVFNIFEIFGIFSSKILARLCSFAYIQREMMSGEAHIQILFGLIYFDLFSSKHFSKCFWES